MYTKITNPVLYGIYELSRKSAERSIKVQESGNVKNMMDDLNRRRIELEFAQIDARIQQEIAIAKRIEDAEEVVIEEFYDVSGKGGLEGKLNEGAVTIGLNAEGRKVTKRIYRFKAKMNNGTNEE